MKNKQKLLDLFGHITETNINTLNKYIELLSKEREKVLVVDIGTLGGKSAIVMANAGENVEVLTVDPLIKDIYYGQKQKLGVEDRVKYFEMTSEEFEEKYCPDVIDACFIDGRHSYASVKHSLDYLVTRMRRGGYVMVHDVNIYSDRVGVAVKEQEGKLFEFVEETSYLCTHPKEGSIYVGRKL